MEAKHSNVPAIEGGSPIRGEFLPFFKPSISEDDIAAVSDALRSGWLTLGPQTHKLEGKLQEYLGTKHVVVVSSCSAAMFLALKALGVGAGDEVVTSANTFASTVEGIVHTGATPVLADIDSDSFSVDPADMVAMTTPRTRAYLPVHFGGQACRVETIVDAARERNIAVLEDAAHSFGASRHGRRIGGFGDATAFSFYATKNFTSGEGGCVATDDDDLAATVRQLSYHGMSADSWTRYEEHGSWYYEVDVAGYKYNISDVLSSLGLSQMARIDELLQRRRDCAHRYTELLSASPFFEVPTVLPDNQHTWHLYVIRLNLERLSVDRAYITRALTAENVGSSVHFIPVYKHPFFKPYLRKQQKFPNCEDYFSRCVSLPIFPDMTDRDIEDVVAALTRIAEYNSK